MAGSGSVDRWIASRRVSPLCAGRSCPSGSGSERHSWAVVHPVLDLDALETHRPATGPEGTHMQAHCETLLVEAEATQAWTLLNHVVLEEDLGRFWVGIGQKDRRPVQVWALNLTMIAVNEVVDAWGLHTSGSQRRAHHAIGRPRGETLSAPRVDKSRDGRCRPRRDLGGRQSNRDLDVRCEAPSDVLLQPSEFTPSGRVPCRSSRASAKDCGSFPIDDVLQ